MDDLRLLCMVLRGTSRVLRIIQELLREGPGGVATTARLLLCSEFGGLLQLPIR